MGKHYAKEAKPEAIRMYFEEEKNQGGIIEASGIRDQYQVKKWTLICNSP